MSENETIEERADEIIKENEKIPFYKKIWNGIVAVPKAVNNWVHKHPYLTAGGAALGGAAAAAAGTAIVDNIIEKHNRKNAEIIDELREDESNADDEGRSIVNNVDDVNVNNVDV